MANIQTSCWLGASGQRRHRNSKWGLSFLSINCQGFFLLFILHDPHYGNHWPCYACLWGQYKQRYSDAMSEISSKFKYRFSIEDKGRGTFCHSLSKANKKNSNQPIPKPNKNYHHHHQQSEQEENNLFILHEKWFPVLIMRRMISVQLRSSFSSQCASWAPIKKKGWSS